MLLRCQIGKYTKFDIYPVFQIAVEKSSIKINGDKIKFKESHLLFKKLPFNFNKVKLRLVRASGVGYKFFDSCALTFAITDPVNLKTTRSVCHWSKPFTIQSQYAILSLDYESRKLNTLLKKALEDYLNGPLTIPFLIVDLEAEADVQSGCKGLYFQTGKTNSLHFVISPEIDCSWAIIVPTGSYVNIHIPNLNLGVTYSSTGACACSVYRLIIKNSKKQYEFCGRDIPKNLLFASNLTLSVRGSPKKELTTPAVGLTKGDITVTYYIWEELEKSWGCGKFKYRIPIVSNFGENIDVRGKYMCRFLLFSEFDHLGFQVTIKSPRRESDERLKNFRLKVSVGPYANGKERRFLEPKSNYYYYTTSKTEEFQIFGEGNSNIYVRFEKVQVSSCEGMETIDLVAGYQWKKVECYQKDIIKKSQIRCSEEKLQWKISAIQLRAIQLVITSFEIKARTLKKVCYGDSALFPVKLTVFNRFMIPFFESCGYHIPVTLYSLTFAMLEVRVNVQNNMTLPDDQAGIVIHFKYRILPDLGWNQCIYYYL